MTTEAKHPKAKNQERTTATLADAWTTLTLPIVNKLVTDLLESHRDEFLKSWVDSGENNHTATLAVNFKGDANCPLVTVKCSWTNKFSDSASEQVDDGTQGKLPLNEDPDGPENRARFEARKKSKVLRLPGGPNFEMGEGSDVQTPEVPAREPLALPPISMEQIHPEGQQGAPVEVGQSGDVVEGSFTMVEHPEPEARAPKIESLTEEETKVVEIIRTEDEVSTSQIQRRLRFGYTKTISILEALYNRGVIGKAKDGGKVQWSTVEAIAQKGE